MYFLSSISKSFKVNYFQTEKMNCAIGEVPTIGCAAKNHLVSFPTSNSTPTNQNYCRNIGMAYVGLLANKVSKVYQVAAKYLDSNPTCFSL